MTTETTKQTAYETTKAGLDKAFANGGIPNIKAFKKVLRDLQKRIQTLKNGAEMFAHSLEDVNKAELAIARLQGQRQAYQERFDWIMDKLNSNA